MNCFKTSYITVLQWLIFVIVATVSTNSFALSNNPLTPLFNYAEFNAAFILGLSLPVVVILALLKQILTVSWRYPVLIFVTLLLQLLALNYFTLWQTSALLITATGFISITFLWQFQQQYTAKLSRNFSIGLNLFNLLFITAVFFLDDVNIYQYWLVYSAFAIFLSITFQFYSKKKLTLRIISLWLTTACYCVVVYLWLHTLLNLVWLITFAVLTYLTTIVNGCWDITQRIISKIENLTDESTGVPIHHKSEQITLDPITNLPTYRYALDKFASILAINKNQNVVAIVFKPLNFEEVNKILGHQNSDILLLQLAYCLRKCAGEINTLFSFYSDEGSLKIARLQGVDFLLVVDTKQSKHPTKVVIDDICQKMIKAVPKAMSFKSFSLNFELAFGIAVAESASINAGQLVAQASDALTEAEISKQMLCYFNNESALYTEQQLAKMDKLTNDINNGNLSWVVHPQVSLINRELKGLEISLDWQCHDGTRLNSEAFEQIAEYSGEIYRLTKQMIVRAFELLVIMHSKGINQTVSVSLSSKDLLEPELIEFIEEQAQAFNMSLVFLVVELNEKVLLNSAFRARMMIDQLRALGVKISIDDFSGSYEALRYLRRASIQQVKIECSQLNANTDNQPEKIIIDALINVIRKMGIPVIATEINNNATEKAYLAIGGDVAQGRLFHFGIMFNKVEQWLTDWQAKSKGA